MKYLIFKIPTQKKLTQIYQVNDSIFLYPGEAIEFKEGISSSFLNSIFYVENMNEFYDGKSRKEIHFSIYENLKNFLRFWGIVINEHHAIRVLETDPEWPKLVNEIPIGVHSNWQGHPDIEFNPSKTQIRILFHLSPKTYDLKCLFEFYQSADIKIKNWINLFLHESNRYVVDQRRKFYDSYIMESAMKWIIIDALLPKSTCESEIDCKKCNKIVTVYHSIESFKDRLKKLLDKFDDREEYCKIIDAFRSKRGKFFHNGTIEIMPETVLPAIDSTTKLGHREVGLEETVQNLGAEGLATRNAQILLHEIIHTLLLNRLIPDLDFWPKFEMLKMAVSGKI